METDMALLVFLAKIEKHFSEKITVIHLLTLTLLEYSCIELDSK